MSRQTRTSPICRNRGAGRTPALLDQRLQALQRRLLVGLPAHDAAHGFLPGRSVATYGRPHANQAVVVRLDLEGFFASVGVGRIYGTLRTAGYPEPVAHCLAGLVTTVLPLRTLQAVPRPPDPSLLDAHWRLGRRLAAPHLPQGAPTSAALANLAAHRLDVRLTALARSWGGRYTRYADDLEQLDASTGRADRRRTRGELCTARLAPTIPRCPAGAACASSRARPVVSISRRPPRPSVPAPPRGPQLRPLAGMQLKDWYVITTHTRADGEEILSRSTRPGQMPRVDRGLLSSALESDRRERAEDDVPRPGDTCT